MQLPDILGNRQRAGLSPEVIYTGSGLVGNKHLINQRISKNMSIEPVIANNK
jgi:hypothetical protein